MQSKLSTIVVVSITLFIVILVDIGAFSALMVRNSSHVLKKQIDRYYAGIVERQLEKISNELSLFHTGIRSLSENTLLTNGLIDELGRESYLPPLLREFTIPGIENDLLISLHDFEMELIESSKQSQSELLTLISKEILIEKVLDQGKIFQDFLTSNNGNVYYFFATPVYYEGNTEGVLLASLNWEETWTKLNKDLEDISLSLILNSRVISSIGSSGIEGETKVAWLENFPGLKLLTKIPDSAIRTPIREMIIQTLTWGFLLLISSLILNFFFVAKRISSPIIQLKEAVSKTVDDKLEHIQINQGTSEIISLINAYNSMIDRLIHAQTELNEEKKKQLKQAYEAGIAENSIDVLHSIGNGITPMVVNISQLKELKHFSLISHYLSQLHETLLTHHQIGDLDNFLASDEKGKRILPFIKQLEEQLINASTDVEKKAKKISLQLEYITNIINLQQKYAHSQNYSETVKLVDVIHDAIEIIELALKKRNIKVNIKILQETLELKINQNAFVQVLLNLLKNAMESLDERSRDKQENFNKIINIKAITNDEQMIQVTIEDNGIGASPETIDNAFKFGFSTKNRGSGFGLHNCANFIKKNKGEMELTSLGKGKGVKVQFTLPALRSLEAG